MGVREARLGVVEGSVVERERLVVCDEGVELGTVGELEVVLEVGGVVVVVLEGVVLGLGPPGLGHLPARHLTAKLGAGLPSKCRRHGLETKKKDRKDRSERKLG